MTAQRVVVFVDTNVIVYGATSADAPLIVSCKAIVRAIGAGRIEARTSVGVIEEVWHLELRGRPGGLDGTAAQAYALFTPLLPVTDAQVLAALSSPTPGLGANDRLHAATCAAHGIGTILSADAAFDAAPGLRRVDPRDGGAVGELVTR